MLWISDGRAVYRRKIRRTYHDPQHIRWCGRPPLIPTPGRWSEVVKQRRHVRLVDVKVYTVLAEPMEFLHRCIKNG